MRSIRAQLLQWLLPGIVFVCVIASAGMYYSAKQAMDADLDAQLGRLAGSARLALRNQTTIDLGGARVPALRAFLAKEEFQQPGQYFELWSSAGKPERRSLNLGKADLPRPSELTRDGTRYDAQLENGERVRVIAMQYPQSTNNEPLDFAVALSRSEGESRLSRLLADLIIGGVVCCAMLCLLLILALRYALRPLERVGEQAAAMGANSLHERFATEAIPSEIAPIVTRLNDLMSRLEQGFERERRFSSDLAHELRTPLAAIRTTSEVAAKWPDQSSLDDFHDITKAATHLQQTVDSLLLLSRIDMASANVSLQSVVLRPLIEECVSLHTPRAQQRDLTFNLQLDAASDIETDPSLLRIIASNLIANATEYAPHGSEIVIIATNDHPILRIENLAPDLTPEDIPRLFDRLWRKDATRNDSSHSGLGLSIASSGAQALGCTLHAELLETGTLQISLFPEK
ncbi:hypothetical protein FEM03_08490 [Phragmitibacter flavus]|uniref:histidine kinase n=1 Tax=Phragmitibacter flavus TaxID=2576071 RepID=A0A5R8KFA2_9BACT|nr:histidine kinase dimerization/phospho-acceptor domain-containing protein [Phragmitibacter flavus]TLD70947.1 hypothetical protein FEM03_08490 [Phragmitibacter flavus]